MIVIDMDMPNNCRECPLVGGGNNGEDKYCCLDTWYCGEAYDFKRDEGCPIVAELPKEHGRLIDADELKKCVDGPFRDTIKRWIDSQPTALEPDKEVEDE